MRSSALRSGIKPSLRAHMLETAAQERRLKRKCCGYSEVRPREPECCARRAPAAAPAAGASGGPLQRAGALGEGLEFVFKIEISRP